MRSVCSSSPTSVAPARPRPQLAGAHHLKLSVIESYRGVVKHHELSEWLYRTGTELRDAIDQAFTTVEACLASAAMQARKERRVARS